MISRPYPPGGCVSVLALGSCTQSATHRRSAVGLGALICHSKFVQFVMALQFLSCVKVAAADSHSWAVHSLSAAQFLSLVAFGAACSYSACAQAFLGEPCIPR